jgi:hypothetical protein
MTLASQVFGAAHLACDAHAYAAPGHRLNPYYMQSRWDAQAHADPAMPTPAEAKTVDEMPTLGVPSYADTDTTLRGQEHTAERLLQPSSLQTLETIVSPGLLSGDHRLSRSQVSIVSPDSGDHCLSRSPLWRPSSLQVPGLQVSRVT